MARSKLNKQQQVFVAAYLATGSATQAAKKAGYSKKTAHSQGPRLLEHVGVKAAIAAGTKKLTDKLELSAERVLLELNRIALVDLEKAFGPDGELLPLSEIPEDVRRAIAGVENYEERINGVKVGDIRKVKMADKTRALELLGKHFKLFTDVTESKNLNINVEPATPADVDAALERFKDKL